VSVEAESMANEATGAVVGEYGALSFTNLKTYGKKLITAKTINDYSRACGHDTSFSLLY